MKGFMDMQLRETASQGSSKKHHSRAHRHRMSYEAVAYLSLEITEGGKIRCGCEGYRVFTTLCIQKRDIENLHVGLRLELSNAMAGLMTTIKSVVRCSMV